ncbi:MAG: MFS transporter [Anaerovoracaceae bacterium]
MTEANEQVLCGKPERKNDRSIIFVAAFSAFLATFNETFLNVSFAHVMRDFDIGVGTVQWLAAAYMLGAAVMVPVSAFLYRSIRTRPLYLFTVGLLVAGSVIGAMSSSFPVLLTGRIVQALGTGMLIPIGMNITLEAAPKQKLGTYMGIMGAMTTLGPSSSVIVAGTLLEFFDWHFLLWFFGALSLLCFLCGAFLLPDVATLTSPKLDVFSVILISLSLIGILYGISTVFGGNVLLAAGAALVGILCMILFVKRQKKLKDPLIQLQPLRIRAFSAGVILNMIALLVIFAMNIVMPLFMQSSMGLSAFSASMVLFPAILLSCVVSPLAGRIYDKKGGKILLPAGFVCIGICTLALGFAYEAGLPVVLAVLYIPVICGSALIIGPVQSFALSHLSPEQNPHGVTVMSTGFQIAGCIGSSLFSGVYGLFSDASKGFNSVCLLAFAFAVAGLVLAVFITRVPGEK